ncbi:hypothetical protein [Lignipirellula cremea]|uniref:Uncharacterized protein n=1 Tax=Lignipirellula cremea TaxID=2528010 RepID=A0A518E1K9_9BACT|nr:hypothetical protein [Lignipirellula cremea]QDU97953.1 hypothetical protein Pla8534_58120 [Lignipirellula cremea]
MWRAFLLAFAASALLLGVESLAVERVVLNQKVEAKAEGLFNSANFGGPKMKSREFVIPEWAPWSLLSGGAITLIYTFAASKE